MDKVFMIDFKVITQFCLYHFAAAKKFCGSRTQAQATHNQPQEELPLADAKEVLARALFLGCTVWNAPRNIYFNEPPSNRVLNCELFWKRSILSSTASCLGLSLNWTALEIPVRQIHVLLALNDWPQGNSEFCFPQTLIVPWGRGEPKLIVSREASH